jgi:membrane protease YdiL (CAAX protease family)
MSNASSKPVKPGEGRAPAGDAAPAAPMAAVTAGTAAGRSGDKTGVPWPVWAGVLFVVIVYYASQVFGALLVSAYPLAHHWPHGRAADWLNNAVSAQFAFILAAEVFTLGAIYYFLKYYKRGFADIGLKRPRLSDPVYGLLAVPVYFVLYLLTVAVVSHFVPGLNVDQQQQIGFDNVSGSAELFMTFVSLVVLPPLTEEIMVRGFLYGTLKKAMPILSAALLTSVLFAAAHLPEGGSGGPLYIAALDTFVLSLVLIYLREKTGSLWASITLHAVKNGVAFAVLFVLHVH